MNLQERLELMLDERRSYVLAGLSTDDVSKLMHEGLGDMLVEACGADGIGTPEFQHERDGWLVRLAGAVLFLLHPEDEATAGTTDPALPSQDGFAALAKAFGEHKPGGILLDQDVTVVRRGDGTYKRKPRPDVNY